MKKKLSIILGLISFFTYAQTEFITKWKLPPNGLNSIYFSVKDTNGAKYSWTASPSGLSGNGTSDSASIVIVDLPRTNEITLSIDSDGLQSFKAVTHYPLDFNIEMAEVMQWGNAKWTTMEYMFSRYSNLQITATDIPDLSRVKSMRGMFSKCTNFNSDISNWDVSAVINMGEMFEDAANFNQDIGDWDVSSVETMFGMFYNAKNFNQDIGSWNVSSVTDMRNMFYNANNFNQNLNNWNVSSVKVMSGMFWGATSYNQNMANWELQSTGNHELRDYTIIDMLRNSGLDCLNYSKTLVGWNANPNTPSSLILGNVNGLIYLDFAEASRKSLINIKDWKIYDDILNNGRCLISSD